MAAPSQTEVEIVLRFLQENKGELEKVQRGLEELAAQTARVFEEGTEEQIERFVVGLKSISDQATSTGENVSASEALMQEAVKGFTEELEKGLPKVQKSFDDLRESIDTLMASLDKGYAAQLQFNKGSALLEEGLKRGIITQQQYDEQMRRLTDRFNRHNQVVDQSSDLGQNLSAVWSRLRYVALSLGAALGITFSAASLISLLRDAAQSEGLEAGLKAVASNAGFAATEVDKAKESIERLGVSSNRTSENLSQLFIAGLNPQQAEKAARAAKSLAGTFARPIEETFEQITNAVSRQSAMMLARQYGIVLEAEEVFLRRSRELGRQLMPSEKRAVFAEELFTEIELRTQATSGGVKVATTLIDELASSWDRLKDTLGETFLPLLKEALDYFTRLVTELNGLAKSMAEVSSEARSGAQPVRTIGEAIIDFVRYLAENKDTLKTLLDILQAIAHMPPGATLFLPKPAGEPEPPPPTTPSTGVNRGRIGSAPVTTPEGLLEIDRLDQLIYQTQKKQEAARALADRQAEKDAIESLKQLYARQRVMAQAVEENEQVILEIRQQKAARQEALDRESYDRGLITLEQYQNGRLARWQSGLSGELDAAALHVNNLRRELARVQWESPGTAKVTEVETALQVAQNRVLAIFARAQNDREALEIEGRNQREQREREIADYTIQTELKTNARLLEARRAAIEQQAKVDRERFGPEGEAAVERRRVQELALLDVEIERADLLQRTEEMRRKLDKEQEEIGLAYLRGRLTESEVMNAQNALIEKRLSLLRTQLASEQKLLQFAIANNWADQVRESTLAVGDLELEIMRLMGTMDTYGKRIREGFTQNLTDALNSIGDTAKDISDIVRDLALSTIKQLQNIASTNAAQAIVRAIVDNTGGEESGGIFGMIGQWFGDSNKPDGSAKKPFHVILPGQTGEGSLVDQVLGGGEKGFFEVLREKISKGWDWLSDSIGRDGSLTRFFSWLSNAVSSVFDSIGGGGGLSGLLGSIFGGGGGAGSAGAGDLIGAFATFAADGGLLHGPSHERGGVPVLAEGGEHITNKNATARWLPLLEAINSGMLDRLNGVIRPRRGFRYADGGLVPHGGSYGAPMTNNVSIHVDANGDISVDGDSERALRLAQAMKVAAMDVIIEQKLPGGALAD